MNFAGSNSQPMGDRVVGSALPDLGELTTGIRDYPDRALVIRSSIRAMQCGFIVLSCPFLTWGFASNLNNEIKLASTRSLDPLRNRRFSFRLVFMALCCALSIFLAGAMGALGMLAILTLVECLLVYACYRRRRAERWNPARWQLYVGVACYNAVRIQMLTVAWLLSFVITAVILTRR